MAWLNVFTILVVIYIFVWVYRKLNSRKNFDFQNDRYKKEQKNVKSSDSVKTEQDDLDREMEDLASDDFVFSDEEYQELEEKRRKRKAEKEKTAFQCPRCGHTINKSDIDDTNNEMWCRYCSEWVDCKGVVKKDLKYTAGDWDTYKPDYWK